MMNGNLSTSYGLNKLICLIMNICCVSDTLQLSLIMGGILSVDFWLVKFNAVVLRYGFIVGCEWNVYLNWEDDLWRNSRLVG